MTTVTVVETTVGVLETSADDQVVINDIEIQIVTEGVQGPRGPAGPAGADAGSGDRTFVAPFGISGHRVVLIGTSGQLEYASKSNAAHAGRVVGVTTHAAVLGDNVLVRPLGVLEEPTWSWDVNLPVWLGLNGALTQVAPNSAAGDVFAQVVGFPMSGTSLFIQLRAPLLIA